jgi:hypothetical protein
MVRWSPRPNPATKDTPAIPPAASALSGQVIQLALLLSLLPSGCYRMPADESASPAICCPDQSTLATSADTHIIVKDDLIELSLWPFTYTYTSLNLSRGDNYLIKG